MTRTPTFVFIDDDTRTDGDAVRFQRLLNLDPILSVQLRRPDRGTLLVPEDKLEEGIDGFILDISLHDHVPEEGNRFVGTGAGLAQDLRLLQHLGMPEGQRPRPIVRLCAVKVFQEFLKGDASSWDVFDLGFDKETIGDHAEQARREIAALVEIYAKVSEASSQLTAKESSVVAANILGIPDEQYLALHSAFRSGLELELGRKVHEAAGFIVREFLDAPGLLIDETLLAVRFGIDIVSSGDGWAKLLSSLSGASYTGAGASGFVRWWAAQVQIWWAETIPKAPALQRLAIPDRVKYLNEAGFGELKPLPLSQDSPGDQPWWIGQSDDPEMRLPVDPAFAYPVVSPRRPWQDQAVWCLEQAKRNRKSPQLSEETRAKLARDLARKN